MEAFFEKLCLDDHHDQKQEQIKMFQSSFRECEHLSNCNIEELQFLCIEDDYENTALFTFPNSCVVARYSFYDPVWSVPERHELVVGTPSTLKGVELLENSSPDIEYVLYPLEQCCELPMSYLIPTKGTFLDVSSLQKIYYQDYRSHHEIEWTEDLTLVLDHGKPYKVLLNGEFLSGFTDDPTHFQLGDCCTIAYTDTDNHLIVCQHGDVSSFVIIKPNFRSAVQQDDGIDTL
jgi:hypothetical protein